MQSGKVLIVDDNAAFAPDGRPAPRIARPAGAGGEPRRTTPSTRWTRRASSFVVADIPHAGDRRFRLRARRTPSLPDAAVALMSAYPTDDADIPPGVPVLVKPFEIEALIALLPRTGPPELKARAS
jgi:hypothetical protein